MTVGVLLLLRAIISALFSPRVGNSVAQSHHTSAFKVRGLVTALFAILPGVSLRSFSTRAQAQCYPMQRVRFKDFNEAVRCFEIVAQDYERQSQYARALVEEHFDAKKVLSDLMAIVLSPRHSRPPRVPRQNRPTAKIAAECISWRWNGNLGDDMIYAAQEAMFADTLDLQQYRDKPEGVLVRGGTLIPKFPEHPDLLELSSRLPTVIWGTGVGDPLFWGKDHIPTWLEVIKNSRYVGVRGPLSKTRLEEWGASGGQIEWIGDPALYFADGIVHTPVPHRLAVNLGTTYGKLYGFDEAGFEIIVVRALQQLAHLGWHITLISVWRPDDEVVERVSSQIPHSAVELWHDDYLRALNSVEKFDLMICEKPHAGVVAACRAVPFVALNYRSKGMDFCLSIGWEEFCIETSRLTPEAIIHSIAKLGATQDDYALHLLDGVEQCKKRLMDAIPRSVAALRNDRIG
ncbi:MAG: polysaccharide pyruvyl transferase family protein [Gemmatimonadaceae bacterium]